MFQIGIEDDDSLAINPGLQEILINKTSQTLHYYVQNPPSDIFEQTTKVNQQQPDVTAVVMNTLNHRTFYSTMDDNVHHTRSGTTSVIGQLDGEYLSISPNYAWPKGDVTSSMFKTEGAIMQPVTTSFLESRTSASTTLSSFNWTYQTTSQRSSMELGSVQLDTSADHVSTLTGDFINRLTTQENGVSSTDIIMSTTATDTNSVSLSDITNSAASTIQKPIITQNSTSADVSTYYYQNIGAASIFTTVVSQPISFFTLEKDLSSNLTDYYVRQGTASSFNDSRFPDDIYTQHSEILFPETTVASTSESAAWTQSLAFRTTTANMTERMPEQFQTATTVTTLEPLPTTITITTLESISTTLTATNLEPMPIAITTTTLEPMPITITTTTSEPIPTTSTATTLKPIPTTTTNVTMEPVPTIIISTNSSTTTASMTSPSTTFSTSPKQQEHTEIESTTSSLSLTRTTFTTLKPLITSTTVTNTLPSQTVYHQGTKFATAGVKMFNALTTSTPYNIGTMHPTRSPTGSKQTISYFSHLSTTNHPVQLTPLNRLPGSRIRNNQLIEARGQIKHNTSQSIKTNNTLYATRQYIRRRPVRVTTSISPPVTRNMTTFETNNHGTRHDFKTDPKGTFNATDVDQISKFGFFLI